jgi:hypothetical protein
VQCVGSLVDLVGLRAWLASVCGVAVGVAGGVWWSAGSWGLYGEPGQNAVSNSVAHGQPAASRSVVRRAVRTNAPRR